MALSMLTEKLDSAGRDGRPSDQAYLAIWGEGPPYKEYTWIHQNFLVVRVLPHLNLPSSTSKVCHSLAMVSLTFHVEWFYEDHGRSKHNISDHMPLSNLTSCCRSWCLIGRIGQKNLHDQSSPRTAWKQEQWILERVWVHASSLKTNCTMVRIQSAFHLRFHEHERIWMHILTTNNKSKSNTSYFWPNRMSDGEKQNTSCSNAHSLRGWKSATDSAPGICRWSPWTSRPWLNPKRHHMTP